MKQSIVCSSKYCFELVHQELLDQYYSVQGCSWSDKMVQTLEAIKGGGGSIKVGTIGTVGSLMTRELDAASSKSEAMSSSCNPLTASESHGICIPKSGTSLDEASSSVTSSIKNRSPENMRRPRGHAQHQIPIVGATTSKRQKQRAPPEQLSNGRDRNKTSSRRSPDYARKIRTHKRSHQIPMLGAENMVLEKTPIRENSTKKGTTIVDIVDVNCGSPRSSLSNRLKKLGFSKLSQSII